MAGVLTLTVGDVKGVPTVVLAMAGIHETGSEIELLTTHFLEAVDRATALLERRGTPVDFVVMDGRYAEDLPAKK